MDFLDEIWTNNFQRGEKERGVKEKRKSYLWSTSCVLYVPPIILFSAILNLFIIYHHCISCNGTFSIDLKHKGKAFFYFDFWIWKRLTANENNWFYSSVHCQFWWERLTHSLYTLKSRFYGRVISLSPMISFGVFNMPVTFSHIMHSTVGVAQFHLFIWHLLHTWLQTFTFSFDICP